MMNLTVVSPEKELFAGEVTAVTLPGTMGLFTILNNHAPIVSSLRKGEIHCTTTDGVVHTLDVDGGFIEASGNVISVCIS